MTGVAPRYTAKASSVAVRVLQLVRNNCQAVEKHVVLVAVELGASSSNVATISETTTMQVVSLKEAAEVGVCGTFAPIMHVDVINSEGRDVGHSFAMVPHQFLQNGRDVWHIKQVTVAPPPMQGVAAHHPRSTLRRIIFHLREHLVEFVDVGQCQRARNGKDPAGVEQIPAPRTLAAA